MTGRCEKASGLFSHACMLCGAKRVVSACPKFASFRSGGRFQGGDKRKSRAVPAVAAKGSAPIKLAPLLALLKSYPDRESACYLENRFSLGLQIPALPPSCPTRAKNLHSVRGIEETIRNKTLKEVPSKVRCSGLLQHPFPNLQVLPLRVVPKKAPGKLWLIHHLSFPKGSLINNSSSSS